MLGPGYQVHTGKKMDFYAEGRFISVQSNPAKTNFVPISIGLRWGGI